MVGQKYAKLQGGKRFKNRGRYKSRPTSVVRKQRWMRKFPRIPYTPRTLRASVAFPKTRLVRHKYIENVSLPAATGPGVIRQYNIYANSVYDPNRTGVGHQPMYHDEMIAIYKYYTVIASYLKVTFNQTDTSQQNYGCVVSQDETLQADPSTVLEQFGGTKAQVVAQRNSPLVLRKSFNQAKYLKTNLAGVLSDDTYKTERGNNPNAKASVYYNIWSGPVNASTTLSAHLMQVEVIYIVMWREPQDATQS